MDVGAAVSKLEKSKLFQKFIKINPEYYLVHAFTMIVDTKEDWQLGYYSKDSDLVVVFEIGSSIKQIPPQPALKKKGTIRKLNLDKVKLKAEGALKVALKAQEKEAHGETVTKQILILQNPAGTMTYNITLITSSFHIINLKISAETGQVLDHTKQSILSLGKQIK